jgi:hypothetical protein
MSRDYIPSSHDHFRLIDNMGRVRAYAYERADFGPTPTDWCVVEHSACLMPAIADCPAEC